MNDADKKKKHDRKQLVNDISPIPSSVVETTFYTQKLSILAQVSDQTG